MRLNRRIRLPSEVHGASASSIALSPVLARVGHRIEVDVIFSILGQDQLGKPLPITPGSDGEGALRLAKALVEVGLADCAIVPAVVQPPSYLSSEPLSLHLPQTPLQRHHSRMSQSSCDTQTPRYPVRSVVIPHTRAFRASNGRVVASKTVFYDEGEVGEAVSRHCRDKGECACGLMWEGLTRVVSGLA